jgi:hypothetical protein
MKKNGAGSNYLQLVMLREGGASSNRERLGTIASTGDYWITRLRG